VLLAACCHSSVGCCCCCGCCLVPFPLCPTHTPCPVFTYRVVLGPIFGP
jgi:hypothetical protein